MVVITYQQNRFTSLPFLRPFLAISTRTASSYAAFVFFTVYPISALSLRVWLFVLERYKQSNSKRN